MARIKFEQWYRKYGIRERGHLTRPRLFPTGAFQFPQEAIWHFREGNVQNGPSRNESLLQDVGGRIFIEHVTELTEKEGNPRRTSVNVQTLQNDYRRRSRGMRPLRRPEALTINPRNILVVNYAMLHPLYRYTVSYRAEYYRWWNLAVTFWKKVQDVHERFDWNQFIDLQVPESIPTFQEFLRLGRDPTSAKVLESFRAPGALDLADIWQWLGDDRDTSAMSALKDPSRIQLVLRMRGHFTVVSLGLLDQWRRSTEPTPSMESYLSELGVDQYDVSELDFVISQESRQENSITPTQLQRFFLLLLRTLSKVQGGEIPLGDEDSESEDGTPPPAETVKTNQQSKRPTPSNVEEVESGEEEAESGKEEGLSDSLPKLPSIGDELEFPELGSIPESPEVPEELEVIPVQGREPSVARESDPTDTDPLDYGLRLRNHADEQLELGLISKATHERLLREARHYETLPDPYSGTGLLKDSLEITQEDLVLESGEQFPDQETVTDKSMLSSTPRAMERQYLEKVLKKDVLNSVLAATLNQNVVVRKYNVEEVHDSMNHFEVHTVTLKPVNGKQSTIRFRLPVVDSDGRFIANGQTNRLRLQRSDVPIRKVNPSRVALTSYYNKTFVDRSSRATNNYARWITQQVTKIGLDPDSTQITDLRLGSSFDQSLEIPRAYSLLSERFTQFSVGPLKFWCNYSKRGEFAKEHLLSLKAAEVEGRVLIGFHEQTRETLTVDSNDTFYLGSEVMGSLPTVLGLPESKAPLDIAEVTVSNKVIPVGLVLAYHFGLNNLIQLLECEVTRHARGTRIQLAPDEYSVVFQDEVLVFSRQDRQASMVLAGLNRYHRALRQFSVWEFDRKDVYHNVLLDQGMGVRYLREIDTLFSVWVDPITRGLLEDMGEPVDFAGLLLRSVELLMTDHSPNEVEGEYMRYRGYERMAGMVYGELARACKTYHARSHYGDAAVDLNPHQVWQRIVGDPSTMIVEEANPYTAINEQEIMTYRGDGGRSGQSMVKRTRIYTDSDLGVVSESTLDSGDVGVVAYLAPDANLTSVRGTTRRYNPEKDGSAKILSTAALMAPNADRDDPKRIGNGALRGKLRLKNSSKTGTPYF